MESEYPASEIFSSPPRSMNVMGWGVQEQPSLHSVSECGWMCEQISPGF